MTLVAICLLWPGLHLMYGTQEIKTTNLPVQRFYAGILILLCSLGLISFTSGFELGVFFWLFSLMACAVCFVQLRIWRPAWVTGLTGLSLVVSATSFFFSLGAANGLA